MATLASTQVDFNFGLLNFDGFPVEVYRVASGGVNGDTATIAPNRFDNVKAAIGGPVSHDVPTSGTGATNVTFTLKGGTVTAGQFDVVLIGFQRQ
ncbi:MAG: hypothetical protein L0Y58_22365 [Verrucomicrobia subdivision 3 bacterium]|nr:hypothetical protein [Limisphaerales bacterium]